jgi:hypothetical protein
MLRCHCGVFIVLETTYFSTLLRYSVTPVWSLVCNGQPLAAHLLKCRPSEHCVGGRRLFTNCLIEVGLIDVFFSRWYEPALASVDDTVQRDVLGDGQLPHARGSGPGLCLRDRSIRHGDFSPSWMFESAGLVRGGADPPLGSEYMEAESDPERDGEAVVEVEPAGPKEQPDPDADGADANAD